MADGLRRLSNLGGVQDSREVLGESPRISLTGGDRAGGVSLRRGGREERFIPSASPTPTQQDLFPFGTGEADTTQGIRVGQTPFEWAIEDDRRARVEHAQRVTERDRIIGLASGEGLSSASVQTFLKEQGLDKVGEAYKPDKLVEDLIKKGPETKPTAIDPRQVEEESLGALAEGRLKDIRFKPTTQEVKAVAQKERDFTNLLDQLKTGKIIIDKAEKAIKDTGWHTSGIVGAVLQNIPGTDAKDLNATIDTIKANLGFEELKEMKAASPTGGALGQVTVREIEFLQAVIANLDLAQSEDQLRENLEEVKALYGGMQKKIREGLFEEYTKRLKKEGLTEEEMFERLQSEGVL